MYLFLDLDNFKLVNDNYGHSVGDKVLQAIAGILRHSVKPDDLIGRYGGDEFVVLVKQVRNLKVLEGITQKILSAIAALDYHEPDAIKLTCSIGAAFAPQDGTDLNRLIYVADQRLYCAKHRGKNMAILEDTPRLIPPTSPAAPTPISSRAPKRPGRPAAPVRASAACPKWALEQNVTAAYP